MTSKDEKENRECMDDVARVRRHPNILPISEKNVFYRYIFSKISIDMMEENEM